MPFRKSPPAFAEISMIWATENFFNAACPSATRCKSFRTMPALTWLTVAFTSPVRKSFKIEVKDF